MLKDERTLLPCGACINFRVTSARFLKLVFCLCVIAIAAAFPSLSAAESKRMKELDPYASSRSAWHHRAKSIRHGILAGAGLYPLPPRAPLNPVFSNRRVRDSYTVDNVAFEATPGFYVFGNLYRPLNRRGKVPGILVAHGHFKEQGWYARTRPENQILCANLAAMGAVVFTYDMVGWGDSRQVSHNAANVLQLQLWDSIRAVDFLESLPEVDHHRIGITGASGGATQTILLAAVDRRIRASMPVAMVSSGYTGNERCEDGMDIRKVPGQPDTNNAEIAAVIAPRPLMIISDGEDWTKSFPDDDFPFIRRVYDLFGSSDRANNLHFPEGQHDYGPSYRRNAYGFFSKAFRLTAPPESELIYIESQQDQAVSNWVQLPVSFPVENEESSTRFLDRTLGGARAVAGFFRNSVSQVFSFVPGF